MSLHAMIASLSPSLLGRIRINSCLSPRATSVFWLTKILTGCFSDTEARSCTASDIVAENSMVCLVWAHWRMISFICSAKYSSNILIRKDIYSDFFTMNLYSISFKIMSCMATLQYFNIHINRLKTSILSKNISTPTWNTLALNYVENGEYIKKKKNKQIKQLMSYLSASSSTRISMFLREKFGELCKWSISLPGVAMTISGFMRRAASCALISNPPV